MTYNVFGGTLNPAQSNTLFGGPWLFWGSNFFICIR